VNKANPLDPGEQVVHAPDTLNHYVNRRGQDMLRRHRGTRARRQKIAERMDEASQSQLIIARFRKHRVATISFYLLALLYLAAIFAEFVAPYEPLQRFNNQIYASPTVIHFVDANGNLTLPFVYATKSQVNLKTFAYQPVVTDKTTQYRIRFFVESPPYKLAGIIPMNVRLLGADGGQPVFLLGADKLGRDLFSRIIYASRVSLFVGLFGVFISFLLGITLGGISGYFGGAIDVVLQRLVEFILSIPQIPLWMALSAAIPQDWTGIQTFFAITVILSLVGWTGLARVVRGKIISLREEDYVTAARISSASDLSIIFRHLLPGFTSYLIVYITLAIPGMILGETTLSFLGLGINPPDISWGALLQQAQDVTVVSNYPWLLMPAAFVMLAVILFNFIGDGLRDAADPYSR
jgi:peptide/nickel transport system permease protein